MSMYLFNVDVFCVGKRNCGRMKKNTNKEEIFYKLMPWFLINFTDTRRTLPDGKRWGETS